MNTVYKVEVFYKIIRKKVLLTEFLCKDSHFPENFLSTIIEEAEKVEKDFEWRKVIIEVTKMTLSL